MLETGTVAEVRGGEVIVVMARSAACARCRACVEVKGSGELRVTAANECGAEVGDSVNLELREGAFFTALVALYAAPLAAFIVGCIIGFYGGELLGLGKYASLTALGFGLLLTAGSLLVVRKQEPRWKKYAPAAVSKVQTS